MYGSFEYVNEDLLSTDCGCIVHGCNAQGVMGSGVAKLIRERYPQAYKFYKTCYNVNKLTLGTNQYVHTEGKIIVNAITQEFYGRDGRQYVSYEAIRSCMKELKQYLFSRKLLPSVAMPKIGSGLGGGDWVIIEHIIKEELSDLIVKIYAL